MKKGLAFAFVSSALFVVFLASGATNNPASPTFNDCLRRLPSGAVYEVALGLVVHKLDKAAVVRTRELSISVVEGTAGSDFSSQEFIGCLEEATNDS